MAVLNVPLTPYQIASMRGVVDFYYYRGIPVARAWPKKCVQPRTLKQCAHWDHLRRMHHWLKKQGPTYRQLALKIGLPPTLPQVHAQRVFAWSHTKTTHGLPFPEVTEKALRYLPTTDQTEAVLQITPTPASILDAYLFEAWTGPYAQGAVYWLPYDFTPGKWCKPRRRYRPDLPSPQYRYATTTTATPEKLCIRTPGRHRKLALAVLSPTTATRWPFTGLSVPLTA